jgi:capsular polysaccharide biosynthesis protein
VLARRWWIVLLVAVVIGVATYAVSRLIPAVYGSSASVAVLVSGTDPNSTTQAENNLASQYAQVVGAQSVLTAAGRNLGAAGNGLSGAITAGTVAGENLVSIRATGTTPQEAQQRAAAVTNAFIQYVSSQSLRQSQVFDAQSLRELTPLNVEIQQATKELAGFSPSHQTSARYQTLQSTLSTLLTQRSAALAAIAQTGVGGRPSLTVVDPAGLGGQVAPKPMLYAVVAFVLGLLIVGRLIVYLGSRNRSG